ncbi:hypothetical protein CferDRAFT_2143 [Chlorobium ferrooxidans DSM 13031]|uniref:Uncharacterized protein n=1 Tax=Chlorobium ferrooxidans DSM 13031 TaxID=377431 RepID=Q0YUZ1_9CHLB|nr:hypothetical protein CferDRAFT_2143 [Chlorobium ferrooxidans DSM 13031]
MKRKSAPLFYKKIIFPPSTHTPHGFRAVMNVPAIPIRNAYRHSGNTESSQDAITYIYVFFYLKSSIRTPQHAHGLTPLSSSRSDCRLR